MSDLPAKPSAIDTITNPRMLAVIRAYYECHFQKTAAAKMAGVALRTIYDWQEKYPVFNSAIEEVREKVRSILKFELPLKVAEAEREIYRRGIEGWDEPIVFEGVQVGTRRVYSDACAKTWLEANCPEKYRSNTVSIGGDGAMIQILMQRLPDDAKPAALLDGEARELQTDEQADKTNLLEAVAQAS